MTVHGINFLRYDRTEDGHSESSRNGYLLQKHTLIAGVFNVSIAIETKPVNTFLIHQQWILDSVALSSLSSSFYRKLLVIGDFMMPLPVFLPLSTEKN